MKSSAPRCARASSAATGPTAPGGCGAILLAEGVSCGLHRIERLMRQQALQSTSAPASAAARSG